MQASPTGKATFIRWLNSLQELYHKSQKGKWRTVLLPENEALIVNPLVLACQLRGALPIPGRTNLRWDGKDCVTHLRSSGKTYRRFSQKVRLKDADSSRTQFLIYKRYLSTYALLQLPVDARRNLIAGLHGVVEILYNPHADIPKEGRGVLHQQGTPYIVSRLEADERKKEIVGESLLTSRILPLGQKGLFLFCSPQQANLLTPFSGENERIIMGPSPEGIRIRTAHTLRKLCQGKPEQTAKALQSVEKAWADLLLDNIKTILEEKVSPNTYFEDKSVEDLIKAYEQSSQTGRESAMTTLLTPHINLCRVPNVNHNSGGHDYTLLLKFGTRGEHEKDVQNHLVDSWQSLIS